MILIISSEKDVHAQAATSALSDMGSDYRILDLSEFPQSMELGISMSSAGEDQFAVRFADGKRLDMEEVTAVWWRRPQPFGLPQNLNDPVHRQFAMQESDLAFKGLWQTSKALWVNGVNEDAAASNKPWQLQVAKEIGLRIPQTLITNSPEDAERFITQNGSKFIFKAFLANALAWRETRLVREEEKKLLHLVRVAPVIFQRYVEARADLRVTVIGERIYAAAAETDAGDYEQDVRMNPKIPWSVHDLPDDIAAKLLELMRRLELQYGAIDLRLTPEGEYVFLEINPAGQFLFIQNATGLEIAKGLASHLVEAGKS